MNICGGGGSKNLPECERRFAYRLKRDREEESEIKKKDLARELRKIWNINIRIYPSLCMNL